MNLKRVIISVFNSPVDKESKIADVIVSGVKSWRSQKQIGNMELICQQKNPVNLTFVMSLEEGRSSARWSQKCEDYLPNRNIFLSEFFFWSSGGLDK